MTDIPRGWRVELYELPGSAPIFHIVPIDDWVGHESRSTCACGPGMEELEDLEIGGVCFWHHALDGREPLVDPEETP